MRDVKPPSSASSTNVSNRFQNRGVGDGPNPNLKTEIPKPVSTGFDETAPLALENGAGVPNPAVAAVGADAGESAMASEAAKKSEGVSLKAMLKKVRPGKIVEAIKVSDRNLGGVFAKHGREVLEAYAKDGNFETLKKELTQGSLSKAGGVWKAYRALLEASGQGNVATAAENTASKLAGAATKLATSAPAVAAFETFKTTVTSVLGKLKDTGAGKAALAQLEVLGPQIAAAAPEIAGKLAPALGVLGKLAKFAGPIGILFALPKIVSDLGNFIKTGNPKSLFEAGLAIGSLAPPPVGTGFAIASVAVEVGDMAGGAKKA